MEECNDLTVKLTGILEKQKDYYEAINKLSERKTDVILKKDIAQLDKIVEAEQILLVKIGEAELKREEVTLKLIAKLGLNSESVTLSKLIKYLKNNNTDTENLLTVTDDLKDVLEKQKIYNKTNMRLIENNLTYIKDVIQKVVIGDEKEKTYSQLGKHKMIQRQNIIDESV